MTAEQTEIFDVSILRVLDVNAGRQFGLGALAIQALLGTYGFTNEPVAEINKRLEYMADREIGFVEIVNKGQFNPSNVTWKITARGINELRSRGH